MDKHLKENGSVNIDKCFKSIKSKSLNYRFFKHSYNKGFDQPSKELSKKIGLDIHTEWLIPRNWPSRDLELLVYVINDGRLKLWYEFVQLNPELSVLNVNDNNVLSALTGVTSMFNIEDIKEFIAGGAYCLRIMDSDYRNKLDKIESVYGCVSYVPSTKTLNTIIECKNL